MRHSLYLLLIAATLLVLNGCVSTITKGADRRTEGAYVEDSNIEDSGMSRIKSRFREKVHVTVTSYNRKALLTGEVPDEATKLEAARIVGTVPNVTDVFNEITIGPVSVFSRRSNDMLISSNIRFRLQDKGSKEFRAERITVTTEANIVYLMGLVSHAEAKIASEVASTSRGVSKVVPYFEYID